jgi:phosphoribosylformylglycinamidine synthase
MAFAGGLGVSVLLADVPNDIAARANDVAILFSESNSRFLCEVPAEMKTLFERLMSDLPHAAIGQVTDSGRVAIVGNGGEPLIDSSIADLKEAWQAPLRW